MLKFCGLVLYASMQALVLLSCSVAVGQAENETPPAKSPAASKQNASDTKADDAKANANDPQPWLTPVPEEENTGKAKPLPALPEKLKAELEGATALNPESTVFLDVKKSNVVLRTEVACNDCLLEMLLVPEGNREHETILRIRSKAYVIHTGLLALGLEPGKPAEFSPMFVPPSGPVVEIEAVWLNAKGELKREPIRNWIRRNIHRYYTAPLSGPPPGLQLPYKNLRWDRFNNEILWYGPMSDEEREDLLSKWNKEEYQTVIRKFYADSQSVAMSARFVFVGSSMYTDETTGEQFYQAEGGHVICTSNFADALLDVQEESSAADGSQTYEGWTERIPPKGTPVLLVLSKGDDAADGKAAEKSAAPSDKASN